MLFLYYLAAINLYSFILAGADKLAAKKGRRRVRERTLFLTAAAGGSPGLLLAMLLFRHKTRHKKFTIGIPALLIIQLLLLYLIKTFII
mgnify:CR=1 FL=1